MAVRKALAKFSPPRIPDVTPPARLRRLLDAAVKHPLVWISGPGGAGKTSLVADFAQRSKRPTVWFHFDPDDGDPQQFFDHLEAAVRQAFPRRRLRLPQLSAEFLGAIPRFARDWFRQLQQRLPAGAVLVFDNAQIAGTDPDLAEILALAAEESAADTTLVIVSRAEPPPAFARLVSNGVLHEIGWADLRMQDSELNAIAEARGGGVADSTIRHLDGWIAGLVLAAELSHRSGDAGSLDSAFDRERIFEYFASEIYSRFDDGVRRFLAANALWPRVRPELAARLGDRADADRILAGLARRNFFTTRHGPQAAAYIFHPLFRDFLLRQFEVLFTAAERVDLRRHARALLEQSGEVELAIDLARADQDWNTLARLSARVGPELLLRGRHPRMLRWLKHVPPRTLDDNATLSLWYGLAEVVSEPGPGLRRLEHACMLYRRQGSVQDLFMALIAVLESRVLMSAFEGVNAWLDELLQLRVEHAGLRASALDALSAPGVLGVIALTRPTHPDYPYWAAAARQIVEHDAPRHRRIMVAAELLFAQTTHAERDAALALSEAVSPLLSDLSHIPFADIMWHCLRADHAYWFDDDAHSIHETALRCAELARDKGIVALNHLVASSMNYAAFAVADPEQAATAIDFMQRRAPAFNAFHAARFHLELGWQQWLAGKHSSATHALEQVIETGDAVAPLAVAQAHLGHARIALDLERGAQVLGALAAARRTARRHGFLHLLVMARWLSAELALLRGQTRRAARLLEAGLAEGARLGLRRPAFYSPARLAELLHHALSANIEPAYARELIAALGLRPPATVVEPRAWPFATEIYCLGEFRLRRDGAPIDFGRKAPKRSLELLKAIVARGGQRVPQSRLISDLWEDYEPAAAERAFRTALYRLRRILGESSLDSGDDTVSINRDVCWVDVFAFERAARPQHDAPAEATVARVLALYQGHFLEHESPQPWTLTPRERLRSRVLDVIDRAAQQAERAQDWATALDGYRRGIELDPLAEVFYQGILRNLIALERYGDAANTYRACERMLSTSFGLPPSAPTTALYQRALDQAAI